ncbi:MAG: hypothetical protein LQ346_006326 [Caloplaca aetnensis]|nr:MAG: hypothetical protein LQ346_006326 [Caloplaca aetnensis]
MHPNRLSSILLLSSLSLAYVLPFNSNNALLPRPNKSLPNSISPLHAPTHTLNGWPDRVPWTLRITPDLELDILGQGAKIAPTPKNIKDIREAFDWIAFQIDQEGDNPEGYITHTSYSYHPVQLVMDTGPTVKSSPVPVSRRDMAKVVNAIKGIFFTYNYGPRVLFGEVRVRKELKANILLTFRGVMARCCRRPMSR